MKQLALFSAAAPGERSPAEFLDESIKGELLALITRAIIATYINERKGGTNDERDSQQDHHRAS